jgi:hypothetical protein
MPQSDLLQASIKRALHADEQAFIGCGLVPPTPLEAKDQKAKDQAAFAANIIF